MKHWYTHVLILTAFTQATYSGARVLVSYRVLELGGSVALIGILTAVFSLAPLLLAVPTGRAVDRRHALAVLRSGVVLTVVAPALIAIGPGLTATTAGFVLLGFAQMLTTVAGQGIVSAMSSPRRRDRRFGGWSLAVSLGQLVGIPLAGVLAATGVGGGTTGTTVALGAMAAVALVAVPFGWLISRQDRRADSSLLEYQKRSLPSLLGERGMKPAIYSSLMVLVALDLLAAYLPVLGEQLGLSVLAVTVLLTVRTLAAIVSRLLLPTMLRYIDRKSLLISAPILSAAPMALVAVVSDQVVIGVLLAVAGFFWGVGQPLTMTWVVEIAGRSDQAAALSLRLTANRLGQVVIPAGAGVASGITGIGAVFIVTGILLACAGGTTWRSLRASTERKETSPVLAAR
ncbi:MFS transporter [Rhodococcus sp. HM1]|uniref:MFS transporter n=1 Tax=unclassified Rhodococcus (in: high G+C Gram-positive bacteria) TaxID=192944 RepID=UPI0018CF6248|nr:MULTISPECIES: MFS transporter [unclassified Rhodococcus (in: high G+C Gram-positive bacteria)]MBH0121263.1 MFS transporter [Rhodococcus sp. CX]MCK8671276.1 MFS transporter [Rhodococcus sp. HM1]